MATTTGFDAVDLSVLSFAEISNLEWALCEQLIEETGTFFWTELDNPVCESMRRFVDLCTDEALKHIEGEKMYTGCELGCCDSCTTKECLGYIPSPDWDGDYL